MPNAASPRGRRSTSYSGDANNKRRRLSSSPEAIASSRTPSTTASSSSSSRTSPPPATMGLLAFANMLQPITTRPSNVVASTTAAASSTPVRRGIMSHVFTPNGNVSGVDVTRSNGKSAPSAGKAKVVQQQQTQRSASSTTNKAVNEEGGSLLARARNMMPAAAAAAAQSSSQRRASSASPGSSVPLLHRASQMRESAAAEAKRVQDEQDERALAIIEASKAAYLSNAARARRAVMASPTPAPAPSRPAAVIRAPAPPPPPAYIPTQPISTLLRSLDVLLACQPLHADAIPRTSTPIGLRPGSLLEVTGPPGSGKTAWLVAMAVGTRLKSLLRLAEVERRKRAEQQQQGEQEEGQELSWSEIAKGAEQVLIIDTEGGMLPTRLLQAARSQVKALSSAQVCLTDASSSRRASDAEGASRKALLLAVVSGLLLTRSTSLASLLAYLQLCFPDPTSSSAAPSSTYLPNDVASLHLPARTSLVILDSLSHHLRGADTNKKLDRQARQLALSTLSAIAQRTRKARITLCTSNQMAVKMFTSDGVLGNFKTQGARGMLVPQLVRPSMGNEEEMMGKWNEAHAGGVGGGVGYPRDESEAARAYAARGSVLGTQTWRVVLFKRGANETYAQIIARPISLPATASNAATTSATGGDGQALPWHTWIPFEIDTQGTPVERPLA